MKPAHKRVRHNRRRSLSLLSALWLALGGALAVDVTMAQSATAAGTYNNADIATDGVADLGQNPAPGGGQCKAFANAMVIQASGGTQNPSGYQTGWQNAGGVAVSSANAAEGDIIQITPAGSIDSTAESIYNAHIRPDGSSPSNYRLHTAIIVSNNGNDSFTVVDANSTAPNTVGRHTFDPFTWASGSIVDIWRMGTVSGGNSAPPDADGDGVPDSQDVAPNTPGPITNRGIPDWSSRTTGDFNGDGKKDVATFYDYGGGETKLWVFTGNGDGTFAGPTIAWDSGGQWNWSQTKVVTGDFNGDGKADIAAFYYYGGNETKLYVFYGSASGLSSPTLVWDSNGGLNWDAAKFVSGDFNGDGKADIAMFYGYANSETKIFEFLGTSTGFATPNQVWDSGVGNFDWNAIKPVVGDFNNDGKADIWVFYGLPGSRTTLNVFRATSTGFTALNSPVWDSGANGWNWSSITPVAGDFNGDGNQDIAVFFGYLGAETKIFEFYGGGDGTITVPAQVWDSGPYNFDWNAIKPVVGDFNNDGKADIATFYGIGGSRTTLNEFQGAASGFNVLGSPVWDSVSTGWSWPNTLIG